ncbi:MAG: hypothetical protein LBE10_10450 [Treponema sp.]|jgi:hypothetical protein|nr:hypothetical protein [Treponema sp.]
MDSLLLDSQILCIGVEKRPPSGAGLPSGVSYAGSICYCMALTGDLQDAVIYLASPASDYMTDSNLIIDRDYCCW